MILCDCI